MLKVLNVHAEYVRGREVLKGVSFNVGKGEIYLLLGPNGSGKTTTFRVITGILPPTKGKVLIHNHDIWEEGVLIKGIVGYLPEVNAVYPDLTVWENLVLVAKILNVDEEDVRRIMDDLGILAYRDVLVGTLSAGLRKRVALARALMCDPEVIVLDEPFSNLDVAAVFIIKNKIMELIKSGKIVVLSSHILGELSYLEELNAKVGIIINGRIEIEARLSDLLLGVSHVNLAIKTRDNVKTISILKEIGYEPEIRGSSIIIKVKNYYKEVPMIISYLTSKGVLLLEVRPEEQQLEAFLRRILTKRDNP